MKVLFLLCTIWNLGDANSPNYSYVGCFNDQRPESVFFWWPNSFRQNAFGCSVECSDNRFRYFGMTGEFGNDCRCGSGYYEMHGIAKGCSTCDYDNEQFNCGSHDGENSLVAVYEISSDTIKTRENFIGCWGREESVISVLGTPIQVAPGVIYSVVTCSRECKIIGQSYAGITNGGGNCYCGNDLQWQDGLSPVPTDSCTDICSDGEPCGAGSQAISLYRTTCEAGEYGDNCIPCHCMHNVQCEDNTGVCPGSCAQGWMSSEPGKPCSEKTEYGMYMSLQNPCTMPSTWIQPPDLYKSIDGSTDTCFDMSTITNNTFWVWWIFEQPMRIHEISIKYGDVESCFSNMSLVSVTSLTSESSTCALYYGCVDGPLFYPKVMEVQNRCNYVSPNNPAMYGTWITMEVQEQIVICEIEII